jgi:molybdopterin converting factor small subunit
MKVNIRLSPPYSDIAGQSVLRLELEEGATVGDLLSKLTSQHPEIRRLLVDAEGKLSLGSDFFVTWGAHIANTTDILEPDGTVRLFPAIGGGALPQRVKSI